MCQIVCATNKDLEALVAAQPQEFPIDLYERFTAQIFLPPLRSRGNESLLLAAAFMRTSGSSKKLSDAARAFILECQWPGNVRELQRAVLGACRDRRHSTTIQDYDLKRHCDRLLHERLRARRPATIDEIAAWLHGVDASATSREGRRDAIAKLRGPLGRLVESLLETYLGAGSPLNASAAARELFPSEMADVPQSNQAQKAQGLFRALQDLGVEEQFLRERGFLGKSKTSSPTSSPPASPSDATST